MQQILYIIAAVVVLAAVIRIAFAADRAIKNRKLAAAARQGDQDIARAMREGVADTVAAGWSNLPEKPAAFAQETSNVCVMPAGHLTELSAFAFLMDCYWTEADSQAAFVWRRLRPTQRTSLLRKEAVLAAYTAYLEKVTESPTDLYMEETYVQPLPIHHLNQEALAEALQAVPEIGFHLSSVRQSTLSIRSSLQPAAKGALSQSTRIYLEELSPSPVRDLSAA